MTASQAFHASMYTDHFGLKLEPFRVTPDPRFFFAGPDYRLLAATLLDSLGEPHGLCLLSGAAGSGKTLLLRQVVSGLADQVPTALIWNGNLEYPDFLATVSVQFGRDLPEALHAKPLNVIEFRAREAHSEGRCPVLVVDEAHSLPDSVIAHLSELLTLRVNQRQALAMVIAVEDTYRAQMLQRLGGNLAVSELVIEAMDLAQVRCYVQHRLRVAGGKGSGPFTDAALQRLAEVAAGLPRLVNMIAGKAMFVAYLSGETRIEAEIIDEVARELWRPASANPAAPEESSQPDRLERDKLREPARIAALAAIRAPSRPAADAAELEQRFVDLRDTVPVAEDLWRRQRNAESGGRRTRILSLPRLSSSVIVLVVCATLVLGTATGREWLQLVGSPAIELLQGWFGNKIVSRPGGMGEMALPVQEAEHLPVPSQTDPVLPPDPLPTPAPVTANPPIPADAPESAAVEPSPAPAQPMPAEPGRAEPGPAQPMPERAEPAGGVVLEEAPLDAALVGQEVDRTRTIRALMGLAVEYLNADRYTEPAGANAYRSYLDVLDLDPDNSAARAGIEELQSRLLRYARVAEGREDWLTAEGYYRGALTIDPDSEPARAGWRRAVSRINAGG
jgi:type II secretory pathway predicted ATPase ExeA